MESRQTRRQRERQERRDNKPTREGLTVGQLKEAEAELADGAVEHEASRATTLAVLAHSWYALDHQREASRTTYQRSIELRKGGRDIKTDSLVQQYAEAKVEIAVVESQIVSLLETLADEEGEELALALLDHAHTNMMTGIGVRFPKAAQLRFAHDAGLLEEEEETGSPEDEPDVPPEGQKGQESTQGPRLVEQSRDPEEPT